MSSAIRIGASKSAIQAARDAIVNLLDSPRDEKTIRLALTTFGSVAGVHHVNITGCTIGAPSPKPEVFEGVSEE